jgi:hypothetical protein
VVEVAVILHLVELQDQVVLVEVALVLVLLMAQTELLI